KLSSNLGWHHIAHWLVMKTPKSSWCPCAARTDKRGTVGIQQLPVQLTRQHRSSSVGAADLI
ncbi:hypothetical protein NQZ68_025761, partial [Dissostichus eleginoides]